SPALGQLVRTCLAKDPDERFQSAHDLKLQLQWIAGGGTEAGIPAVVSSRRKRISKVLMVAVFAGWMVAAIATMFAVTYARRLVVAKHLAHSQIVQPSGFDFASVIQGAPALSPDGQRLAFVAIKAGTTRDETAICSKIFIRQMSSADAVPVVGTEGASFPFCSPDGRYLIFFAQGKLKKVDASDGPDQ